MTIDDLVFALFIVSVSGVALLGVCVMAIGLYRDMIRLFCGDSND